MFVSPYLIYTELHKTGGSHIGRWLKKLLDGEQIGKHNRIPSNLWNNFIVGSVRNPWDWYVSLWAYGCGKQGSVYSRTTKKFNVSYYTHQLHPEMGLKRTNLKHIIKQTWRDTCKPVDAWRESYRDYKDAAAFRQWLHLLFDYKLRYDVGEGYGFSPVSHNFGLMTYRFLKLYSRIEDQLYKDSGLSTILGVEQTWKYQQLTNYMIRCESLEDDLLTALERAGFPISVKQKQALQAARNHKTNSSKRLPVHFYYDQETLDLVHSREELIINNFEYKPPTLATGGSN